MTSSPSIITQAAPKTKRGGKHRDEEEGEDDDKIAAGKQLDKFKAMEDQVRLHTRVLIPCLPQILTTSC